LGQILILFFLFYGLIQGALSSSDKYISTFLVSYPHSKAQ